MTSKKCVDRNVKKTLKVLYKQIEKIESTKSLRGIILESILILYLEKSCVWKSEYKQTFSSQMVQVIFLSKK